jgi:hypothetical protein
VFAISHADAYRPRVVLARDRIGAGFTALHHAQTDVLPFLRCNFSTARAPPGGSNLAVAISWEYTLTPATLLNDTHITCATPLPSAPGAMPLRVEVGNYTASHRPSFGGFTSYDVEASAIHRVRMLPGGTYPVGGAFSEPADIFLSGTFEDYGTPRCRFSHSSVGELGGVWMGTSGVVHNASLATCGKPRFGDATRGTTPRYSIAFAANGQCFRPHIPQTDMAGFYALNSHVASIAPLGLPLLDSLGGPTSASQPTRTC